MVGLSYSLAAQTSNELSGVIGRLKAKEPFEELVISVTKTPQEVLETASAIQVITQEDISRSGASSLPEALRLAPNLQVAQVNSHDWAISARGFNNTLANKLLVLIDGRTVYTPLFAGVYWDVQNVLLEDVDRIEVVSGPGGTLWGANAVDGVINVITKSAEQTQGTLVTAGGGTFLQDFGAIRYGGNFSSNVFFRLYGQHFDRNSAVLANGEDATNGWNMTQGGFRINGKPEGVNEWVLQGDAYGGAEEGNFGDTTIDGQNILGRWIHNFSAESALQAQTYFDRTWRRIPNSLAEELQTFDFDFQHRFEWTSRHRVVWGAGYRHMEDDVQNGGAFAFLPPHRDMDLFSGFVQDEIALVEERLKLTLGTKLEHNDFSGLEVQPSGRLAWTPEARQTLWGAISRAVRSPSRIDSDIYLPPSPPFLLAGNPDFESETLIAYELGYRVQPHSRLGLSIAGFFNQYDDLRSLDQVTPTTQILANSFEGETWGVELSATWRATDRWRLRGGYTYLQKDLRPSSPNANPSVREGNDPENQFLIQSMLDLPAHFQFDVVARYVDRLPSPPVSSYSTLDVRLAWHYQNNLELSLIGQNLLDSQHPEFGAVATRREIPRSVYGKVTWKF